MVLEQQVFGALRLVIQLGCQLRVLDLGQLGRALQLVLVADRVFHTHLSDLHEHVLAQLVDLLDAVLLDAFNQIFVGLLLGRDHLLPHVQFALLYFLIFFEVLQVFLHRGQLRDLFPLCFQLGFELSLESFNSFL